MITYVSAFEEYLVERLDFYRQFYNTDEEFVEHLRSGEVTVSFKDLVRYQMDFELLNNTVKP